MGVLDIYHKRKQLREKAGHPDVYRYDYLPKSLRIQIMHIWRTAIGPPITGPYNFDDKFPNNAWISIHDILCRELGLLSLVSETDSAFENCCGFLLKEPNVDKVLSLVEVSFRMIERVCSRLSSYDTARVTQDPDDAIDEFEDALDDVDESEELLVTIYIDNEEKGTATWNVETGYHEWQWKGPSHGTSILNVTAQNTEDNIGSDEMEVWNLCFLP